MESQAGTEQESASITKKRVIVSMHTLMLLDTRDFGWVEAWAFVLYILIYCSKREARL